MGSVLLLKAAQFYANISRYKRNEMKQQTDPRLQNRYR